MSVTIDHIQRAIALTEFDPAPAMLSMAPLGRPNRRADPPPREAGVLILFTHAQDDWHIILTRRTAALNGHSGQMSFPGGRRDPQDANFWQTALRETHEELGIETTDIQCLGSLTPLYIPPSHFDVYPWVGYLPAFPALNPNPQEVAAVYFAPISALLDPTSKTETDIALQDGMLRRVPAYLLCDQIVWGATAIMLCELEHRLRAVMG